MRSGGLFGFDLVREFNSSNPALWTDICGVTLDFSRPGKPTDNAFLESFNGRLRDECRNAHWLSLDDARAKIGVWRRDFNECRPSTSIGWLTPIEYSFATANIAAGYSPST